jgi:hypothetical protein
MEGELGRTAMSARELSRVDVMNRVAAGAFQLRSAAEMLGVSYRQASRIVGLSRRQKWSEPQLW